MIKLKEHNLLNFLVITSAIYLVLLPFGLPHVGFMVGLFLFIYHIPDKKYAKTSFWFFLLIAYLVFLIDRGSDIKTAVNNVSSMMMFPIVIDFFRKRDPDDLLKISYTFIKVTVYCFIIETVIRYSLSILIPMADGLYRFKFHSIFFLDTNFLGLVLLVIIFYIRFLEIFFEVRKLKIFKLISIILLFLSISRAAILAWIICEFLLFRTTRKNIVKKYLQRLILLTILGCITGAALFLVLQDDPSFRSKLYILELVENSYEDFNINPIFGVGLGNSQEILGIFPHNSVLLYFLEIGAVGIGIKIILLLYIFIKSKGTGIIIFIPYFIATMSATGYATHYLYVTLAITCILMKKHIAYYKQYALSNENIGFNSNL